jgi:hypothetical protein
MSSRSVRSLATGRFMADWSFMAMSGPGSATLALTSTLPFPGQASCADSDWGGGLDGPGMREHSEPVGLIVGELAQLCVGDFYDIDLDLARGCWYPDSGRSRTGHVVLSHQHIKLRRFTQCPPVSDVKIASGPVGGAEPTQDSKGRRSPLPEARFWLQARE